MTVTMATKRTLLTMVTPTTRGPLAPIGTAGSSRDGLNRNMMCPDIESRYAVVRNRPRSSHGVLLTLNRLLAATVLLVIAPVAAAHAQGVEGTRSADALRGYRSSAWPATPSMKAVGTIDGKPSVFVEQALSNHFSDALRLRFTGSLGLDYNKEVFATFAYGKYNGTERIVGSVSGYPLLARLSNADAFDLEGGLRYYLRPEGPIRTYVAGALGLRFLAGDGRDLQSRRGGTDSGQPAVLQGLDAVDLRRRYRCQLRRLRHDRIGG